MPNFTNSGPVCLTQARSFINGKDGVTVAASNICTSDLFSTAGSNSISLPGGNDDAPHGLTEFYGMNYTNFDPSHRIAIGAPGNDDGTTPSANAGQVRVYEWSGSSWSQLGSDIDGNPTGNVVNYGLGEDLALSSDGNTLVIGAVHAISSITTQSGNVHVYDWNGSSWNLRGSVLAGSSGDVFGFRVAISANGNIIAVNSPRSASTTSKMKTEIFAWNGSSWAQRGADIEADTIGDGNIGASATYKIAGGGLAISSDGSIIAIGHPAHDVGGSPNDDGQVKIYAWNGSSYVQRGSNIENTYSLSAYPVSHFGDAISMNGDGTIVAIGTHATFTSTGMRAGIVEVFEWNASSSSWSMKGSRIDGVTYDRSGKSVSLSDDGLTMAIGAYTHDGGQYSQGVGTVRIYSWSGSAWTRKGGDIDGEATGDLNGWDVHLSPNGNSVVIGAIYNDGTGTSAGHTRVFDWNGTSWSQRGGDIDGEYAGDRSGTAVTFARA